MRVPRCGLRAALVAASLAILAGCADTPVAPPASDSQAVPRTSGVLVTSLWRPSGVGLEYLGASSGHVTITRNTSGYSTSVERASTVVLPRSEVDSLRSSLSPALAVMSPSGSVISSRPTASNRGGPFLLRPSFGGRSIEQKTADG